MLVECPVRSQPLGGARSTEHLTARERVAKLVMAHQSAHRAGACAFAAPVALNEAVVRLWGAYAAVKHAVAHLRPGGSIVLSSGIAGTRPESNWTVAAAICGALDALMRALAVKLAPIRVNAVAPGVVRTDLWREMSEEDRSAMYDLLSEALPVGRMGEVGDIAETFLYLMANGYSSGTIVTVDGGSVLV